MLRAKSIPQVIQILQAVQTAEMRADSRTIQAGDVFVAWPGHGVDARQFVSAAFDKGAQACVVEEDGVENWSFENGSAERIISLPNLRQQAGGLAAAFYQEPSRIIKTCAFTGTNGKTSSTWWLVQVLDQLSASGTDACGLIGTLGVGRGGNLQTTGLTTPDPITIHRHLREFADAGCAYCAMEASSIGIAEGRMQGVWVHTAVFTNFTQDHLDYHASLENYWAAKKALFEWPGLQAAVINADDARAAELLEFCQDKGVKTFTYALHKAAEFSAETVAYANTGLHCRIRYQERVLEAVFPVFGSYNLSNILSVIATAVSLGFDFEDCVKACTQLKPVPGRMEKVETTLTPSSVLHLPIVLVDYAHTPDALEKALLAAKEIAADRKGQLWCVFGCGGNRDSLKRPLMGGIAESCCDVVVLTSDNPRNEDPLQILQEIKQGMKSEINKVEPDRAQAIEWAISQADPSDVILIAGKGHEDYQEIQGVKLPFSDQDCARAALNRRAAR